MKISRNNLILAIVLALLGATPYCYAQSLDDVTVESHEFKLNSVSDNLNSDAVTSKTEVFVNEYKLSLGSQMLNYQNTSKVALSDAKHIETGYKGVGSIKLDESVLSHNKASDIGSVITLNNSYEANSIGFNESNITGISFTTKTGKFDLNGSYSQSSLPVASANESNGANGLLKSSRASVSSDAVNDDSAKKSVEASLASDYYLEAVYNFKPTIKGKVAFKKSMIDSFDSKENVKVEGIVEATSDVSIKAGYSEENRSEVETSSPREKKVYTEFILKF